MVLENYITQSKGSIHLYIHGMNGCGVRDKLLYKADNEKRCEVGERMSPEGGLTPGELKKQQRLHCGCSGTRGGMVEHEREVRGQMHSVCGSL